MKEEMSEEDKAKIEKYKDQFERLSKISDNSDDDIGDLEKALEIGKEIGLTEEELTPNKRLIEVAKKLEDESLSNKELNKLGNEVKQIQKSLKKIKW